MLGRVFRVFSFRVFMGFRVISRARPGFWGFGVFLISGSSGVGFQGFSVLDSEFLGFIMSQLSDLCAGV